MLNFMEDFLTYQVKNGDTLSSVSILFNIPAEEIKTFPLSEEIFLFGGEVMQGIPG